MERERELGKDWFIITITMQERGGGHFSKWNASPVRCVQLGFWTLARTNQPEVPLSRAIPAWDDRPTKPPFKKLSTLEKEGEAVNFSPTAGIANAKGILSLLQLVTLHSLANS